MWHAEEIFFKHALINSIQNRNVSRLLGQSITKEPNIEFSLVYFALVLYIFHSYMFCKSRQFLG